MKYLPQCYFILISILISGRLCLGPLEKLHFGVPTIYSVESCFKNINRSSICERSRQIRNTLVP